MSGWPVRSTLQAFGPHPRRNFGDVRGDDQTSFNAEYLNLDVWQTAGAGLVVPKVFLVLQTVNDAAPIVVEHHEVWRPRDDGPAPTPARSAEGVFTFTYHALVADMDAHDVSPGLLWCDRPAPQVDVAGIECVARATAENVITVRLFSAGVASDVPGTRIVVKAY